MSNLFKNKKALLSSLVVLSAVSYFGYQYYLVNVEKPQEASQPKHSTQPKDTSKPEAQETEKEEHGSEDDLEALSKDPTPATVEESGPKSHGFPTLTSGGSPPYPLINDWEEVVAIDEKSRQEIAEEFKLAGNHCFNTKDFNKALELYGNAIKCNPKDAVFYSNRAAVWGSLKEYQKVIEDTSDALKLKPNYVKCFCRRAFAYEQVEDYQNAVLDYTSACILKNFEDEALNLSVDRVLNSLAEVKVKDIPITQEFPSAAFIKSYLSSFTEQVIEFEATEGTGDFELKLALNAVDKVNRESYKQAVDHFSKAINMGLSCDKLTALAYEYKGTFEYLQNKVTESTASLERSIELNPTCRTYLKLANINIEVGEIAKAQTDFENAQKADPNSTDLFYQLGQFAFLRSEWSEAISQYEKCNPDFVLAQIQLAIAFYRLGKISEAKQKFEDLIKAHPEDGSIYNYYGEMLLDLKEIRCIELFDKSIALEKLESSCVMPMINKALALMGFMRDPSDVGKAIELCRQARALDPYSAMVITTLAQLELQQSNVTEAIELFEFNARLVRTTAEQVQAYTFAEAARAQLNIGDTRPVIKERLQELSRLAGQ